MQKGVYNLEDLILVVSYLPTQNSPFYNDKSSKNIFFLEEESVSLITDFPNCSFMILGDSNARIGELNECFNDKSNVAQLEIYNDFFSCPFKKDWKSCDKIINVMGEHLVDLFKLYSWYILNVRRGRNKNISHYTYLSVNGCSVIDYCLVSLECFRFIQDFCVEERAESQQLPLRVSTKNLYIIY